MPSRAINLEERITKAMKDLGFTVSEARAYLALLKSSPATGYELAVGSGVPRSAIYNVLKQLQARGLVNSIHGKPAKYIPLSPERLAELLETRFSQSLTELKSSLSGLSVRPAEINTWTIQGYKAMLEAAQTVISSAKKSVYASLWYREAEQLKEHFATAVNNGVEVVLFSFTKLPEGLGRVLSYNIDEAELRQYWNSRIILIADQREVILGGAEQTDENRAVITAEPALVEMAISNLVLDVTLYGRRHKIEISDVVSHLTEHLAPIEDLAKVAFKNGF